MSDPLCHTDEGRPPTAEERMREAVNSAFRTNWDSYRLRSEVADSAAFACARLLEAQRECILAWAEAQQRLCSGQSDDAHGGLARSFSRDAAFYRRMAVELRQKRDLTWAERTGWKMEETLDAT